MRALRLTKSELRLLSRALTIAAEDGSIFGAANAGSAAHTRICVSLDEIQNKLTTALYLATKGNEGGLNP